MSKLITLCYVALTFCFTSAWSDLSSAEKKQKTILIISSKGGGGHTAAAKTLQKLVGNDYNLKIVYPIDQLRIWGVPSGEQAYNAMLSNGWIRSMNFIVRNVAPHLFSTRQNQLEEIIGSYIQTFEPSLVISLIPFVNLPASEAAKRGDVPYLVVSTDNDLRNWALGMEKMSHPNFKITIGADLPSTRELLIEKNVPDYAIETIGLPLRPEFFAEKDKEKIKKEFQISPQKSVILIMMGGAGAYTAYEYAKKIGKMNLGTHLLVVAGRNPKLKKDLEALQLHPSNSLTVFGFTEKVSDLMAVSDLIVTKPGPGTINEAMAMKLPILIDNTEISLFWERANVDMVMSYGVGQRIRNPKEIKTKIVSFLKDSDVRDELEKAFYELPYNSFHIRIKEIISDMISLKEKT